MLTFKTQSFVICAATEKYILPGRRGKWTWLLKLNLWTKLFTFHFALMTLEKAWIQIWVKSRLIGLFSLYAATGLEV